MIIEGETDRHPTAHTCFFQVRARPPRLHAKGGVHVLTGVVRSQLCLPPYESVDIMYEKLTTAIAEGMAFDEGAV